jgi:hypothetical protein
MLNALLYKPSDAHKSAQTKIDPISDLSAFMCLSGLRRSFRGQKARFDPPPISTSRAFSGPQTSW